MAPRIEDHWLWLGLGVFTFIAVRGVSYGLSQITTLTTVCTPGPRRAIPFPVLGKEDAIKTSSLRTLALCSNTEIRRASTKILCSRFFAHGPSRSRLLNDLSSTNKKVQKRARRAFSLLCDHGVVQEVILPPTPGALRSGWSEGRRRPNWGERHLREPEMRDQDDSLEERDLRRRRREAMIINEGDRPVSQEDVWMRDGEGRLGTEEIQVNEF